MQRDAVECIQQFKQNIHTHKKSELKHIKKVRKNGIDAQAEWHKMSGDCVIKNASIFSIDHLSLC